MSEKLNSKKSTKLNLSLLLDLSVQLVKTKILTVTSMSTLRIMQESNFINFYYSSYTLEYHFQINIGNIDSDVPRHLLLGGGGVLTN